MSEEKKIIVDEDWKTQVQAEKEAAAQRPAASAPKATEATAAQDPGDPAMPPATFELLITTLATEALVALGQMPHPGTGKAQIQPNQAKYLIDTLGMLREKTQGNLTPGEQQLIESLLHQLRLVFLDTANPPSSP